MDLVERINTEFGLQIFSELLGFTPTKNGEKVRLFDNSKHSQDTFYFKGKKLTFAHLSNFSNRQTFTPISAYAKAHNITNTEAVAELKSKYILNHTILKRTYIPPKQITIKSTKTSPITHANISCEQSITNRHKSNLIRFLRRLYPTDIVAKALESYAIGYGSKDYDTIFWYKDNKGAILNYQKQMPYNYEDGKRIKDGEKKEAIQKGNSYMRGFYGEHLLSEIIFILESEKSAIITHIHLHLLSPETDNSNIAVWACGGLDSLRKCFENCTQNLIGKKIILVPDTDLEGKSYLEWAKIACKLIHEKGFDIKISTFLEESATTLQKERKYDLADFYVSYYLQKKPELQNKIDARFYLPHSPIFPKGIDTNKIYKMYYEWYKNTKFLYLFEFYEFVLVCGSEAIAKEQISKYLEDAIFKGYPTEKLNTWLFWIQSPESIPHKKNSLHQHANSFMV